MAGSGLDRRVTAVLEALCRLMWGFAPRMIPFIVHRMGPVRAIGWFAANMPRYLVTFYVLGPLRAHLACMVISMYNGCVYCSFGHAYALELIYLRDRNRLFPLDAHTLSGWLDLEPRQLGERMRAVLQEAGLHVEALWVDRTIDLVTGAQQPVDSAEARLAHLVRMIGTMNEIANAYEPAPDQAMNPINKDTALKARYAEMRATAGS